MLGGHAAVEAAMSISWPSATGEIARLAHVPHLVWLGTVATMLNHASASIMATGDAFETLRAATPNPGEVVGNQSEHMALVGANFLGMLTPLIVANRGQYTEMWMRVRPTSQPTRQHPWRGAGDTADTATTAEHRRRGGWRLSARRAVRRRSQSDDGDRDWAVPAASEYADAGVVGVQWRRAAQSITELPQQAFGQLSSLASSLNVSPDDLGADFSAGDADWVTQTPQAGVRSRPRSAALAGAAGWEGPCRPPQRCAVPAPGRPR